MFEYARLAGTPITTIVVQTREGKNVPNEQAAARVSELHHRIYADLRQRHFGWLARAPATGTYNCFGLVWAARRTAFYEDDAVVQILREDRYRVLGPAEAPAPGDIAIYRGSDGYLLHAGQVVEIRPLLGSIGTSTGTPWVLSKWSDTAGEDIHACRDVPSHYGTHTVEFWTDRA